jgi:hypothetical protein
MYTTLQDCTSQLPVPFAIKYLYIYIYVYKGSDCTNVDITNNNEKHHICHDKVSKYLEASAPEAMRRLLQNKTHDRSIKVHATCEQLIFFEQRNIKTD